MQSIQTSHFVHIRKDNVSSNMHISARIRATWKNRTEWSQKKGTQVLKVDRSLPVMILVITLTASTNGMYGKQYFQPSFYTVPSKVTERTIHPVNKGLCRTKAICFAILQEHSFEYNMQLIWSEAPYLV